MRPPLASTLLALFALPSLAGCDLVFGNELPGELEQGDAQPDAHEDYDRCAPATDADPLRYQVLANPNSHVEIVDEQELIVTDPWPWEQARAACQRNGFDLIVLNDERELGQIADVPAWVGQKHVGGAWQAVDECEPFTAGAEGTADRACGVVTGPLALSTASCTEASIPPPPEEEGTTERLISFAICETPRPTTVACLPNDVDATTYTVSEEPMSRDAAIAFCAGRDATLAEIGSHAEWLRVAALAGEQPRRFWTNTTFDGAVWRTASTCPMLYSWSGGDAGAVAADACAATELVDGNGMQMSGLVATPCTASAIHALCES